MNRAYDFATIGFRPDTVTEEFVTIGALAVDAETRQFDYVLLESEKVNRIEAMFPEAKELYTATRKGLETELAAIQRATMAIPAMEGLFSTLTNPREGVLCFPVKGRRLAADMEEVLIALRQRFIERHFPTVA